MYKINFGEISGIELSEGWGLLPDPMGRCRRQKWWNNIRTPGYFFPSYDDDAFWPTKVPASYNIIHPELEYYEGEVVYLKTFEARFPLKNEKVFMHFEAVADRCNVFLNGDYIGEHDGGHTAFTLDVTQSIMENNRLLIIVDNKRLPDGVPGTIHDWFHCGGIHRPVKIFYRQDTYIRDVAVTTSLSNDEVNITLKVLMEAQARDQIEEAKFELKDVISDKVVLACTIKCQAGSWFGSTVSLPIGEVNLWSTETPFLYQLKVTLKNDIWTDTIGIREILASGKEILLNGKPIILRGIAAWTEDSERGIFSMGKEIAEKTVSILSDLNCNFARAGHCPQSREFIKECDQKGILLWMEVPAYWIDDMHKSAQSRRALKAIEEMIREHRNSPSVVFWSIGNECIRHSLTEPSSNLAYFIEAADFVHEMDPSRLVTYTSGIEGIVDNHDQMLKLLYPKQLIDKLDVVSINSYSGIHQGVDIEDDFNDQYSKIRSLTTFHKPVILAEAGIDAVKGEQGFDFGEVRQVEYNQKLQDLLFDCSKEGSLQGMCLFVLNDFKTPIKLGRYQRGYNRKGIVTKNLEPKQAYYTVQKGYAKIQDIYFIK